MSWLLGRCYAQTGDANWWEQAMQIATTGLEGFLQSSHTADDLYHGRSGALLALLLLYEIRADEQLIGLMEQVTTQLLKRLMLHQDGICWGDQLAYSHR